MADILGQVLRETKYGRTLLGRNGRLNDLLSHREFIFRRDFSLLLAAAYENKHSCKEPWNEVFFHRFVLVMLIAFKHEKLRPAASMTNSLAWDTAYPRKINLES